MPGAGRSREAVADARCRGRRYRWARHCHQEAEPEAGNGDPRGRVPLPLAEHGLLPARPPRPPSPRQAPAGLRGPQAPCPPARPPRLPSLPLCPCHSGRPPLFDRCWRVCALGPLHLQLLLPRHPSPRSPHGWPVRVSVRVSPYWTLTQAAAPSPPTPSDPSGCLTAVPALGHRVTVCAPTSRECHVGGSTRLVPAVPLAAVGPHCGSAS